MLWQHRAEVKKIKQRFEDGGGEDDDDDDDNDGDGDGNGDGKSGRQKKRGGGKVKRGSKGNADSSKVTRNSCSVSARY